MSQEVANPAGNAGKGKEEDTKHTNEETLNKSVKNDGHLPPLQNGKRLRENEEESDKDENGENDNEETEAKRMKISDEKEKADIKTSDVDVKEAKSAPQSNGEEAAPAEKEEKSDSPENMETAESPSPAEAKSSEEATALSKEKAESDDDSKKVEKIEESKDDSKSVPPVSDEGPLDLGIKKDTSKSTSSEKSAEEDKTSDAKGSESDKENVDEGPMDLSKPLNLSSKAAEDIIMLSDDDENGRRASKLTNGTVELNPEQIKERKKLVRLLQENLRNEEAKLVLLKKIRQSQMMHTLQDSQSNQVNKGQGSQNSSRGAIPPPLVRGQPSNQSIGMRHSSSMPVLNNRPTSGSGHSRSGSNNNSQGPPPLVMAPHHNSQSLSGQHGSGSSSARGMHAVASSPNLMAGFRGGSQSQSNQPEQTPAQRQAAAKLALRKQLEKTLLQIPPPKPPPPEMNFIPSLVGNEFIMLVGLEDVVKRITEKEKEGKGEVKYVFNPFTCVQCSTDFTPVWKRDRPGSKNVICEACVTSNQKKALKQEHTNRLKSAFVKALQQEQEIEQRMQQQQQREREREKDRERERERERERDRDREREREKERETQAAHLAHTAAALSAQHAMAAAAAGVITSPMNLSTAMKPTSEQMRQHQNLIQAHQAQLRAAGPLGLQHFNPRGMPFPFTPITKADIQRQYLLDMIPQRSLSGNSMIWKT